MVSKLHNNIDISIVLPSRGRPERLNNLLDSISATTANLAKIEVVVLLDHDDEKNYLRRDFGILNFNFFLGEPGRSMGELNRDCVSKANGDTIFFTNDDVLFRTQGWDVLLMAEISRVSSPIYLMYPNDLLKGHKLCTFPIMDRKLLLEHPDMLPSIYSGAFMDLHIMDIFKAHDFGSAITYLGNLVCEHQHYRTDAALFDATYKNRDRFGDDERFIELAGIRSKVVSRLNGKTSESLLAREKTSVFRLLSGSASLHWRVKLFLYMLSRQVYRLILIRRPK
jgi:hypothetical protein